MVEGRIKNLRSIMKVAWEYYWDGLFGSFGECLKASWKRWKLIDRMMDEVVKFVFWKKNGELRVADGTLMGIEKDYRIEGNGDIGNDVIRYMDVEKNGWRSCRIENLV